MQLKKMVEALTTKSGDIPTSTVESMNASIISKVFAEHTTVIDNTSSDSQLIETNLEAVEKILKVDANIKRGKEKIYLSLKDNNLPNQSSTIDNDSILMG